MSIFTKKAKGDEGIRWKFFFGGKMGRRVAGWYHRGVNIFWRG